MEHCVRVKYDIFQVQKLLFPYTWLLMCVGGCHLLHLFSLAFCTTHLLVHKVGIYVRANAAGNCPVFALISNHNVALSTFTKRKQNNIFCDICLSTNFSIP
jgi:hypothetical protein